MSELIIKTIGPRELRQASLQGPIDLIDVRTREEFQEIRVPSARNVPLDTLDPAAVARIRLTSAEKPLYFICAVGARSAWACEMMMAAGYENVVNVEGGTQAWYLAGLPVEQGAPDVAR
jgi:rhodanese-related sulfurtransferase